MKKVCKIATGLMDLILDTPKSMTVWALGSLCLALLEQSSDLSQAVLASQGERGKIGRKQKREVSKLGESTRAQGNLVSWAEESCRRSHHLCDALMMMVSFLPCPQGGQPVPLAQAVPTAGGNPHTSGPSRVSSKDVSARASQRAIDFPWSYAVSEWMSANPQDLH